MNILIHNLNNHKSLSEINLSLSLSLSLSLVRVHLYIYFNMRIRLYISGKETWTKPVFANSTWLKIMKFWRPVHLCKGYCNCPQLNFLKQVVPLKTIQKTLGHLLLAQTVSQRSTNILMILYDIYISFMWITSKYDDVQQLTEAKTNI